jgi:uncharacterized delta-60 repeat protein
MTIPELGFLILTAHVCLRRVAVFDLSVCSHGYALRLRGILSIAYCFNSGLFSFGGTFGLPDDALFIGGSGTTYDFDFQSDGRIVSGGPSTSNALRRYLPNGVLDATFKAKFSATDLEAIIAQPDDKILIGGTFTTVNGVARRNLARLNADGNLDTNFVTSVGPNSSVYAIALAPGGKGLVAGKFTTYDGLARTGLARIFLDPPALPQFIAQPGSTNLMSGQSLRLAVAVNAAPPLRYQWKQNRQPLQAATNSVFFLPHVQSGDAGIYTVEVTSREGSVTSDEAIVGVDPAPIGPGALDTAFANAEAANRTVNAFVALPDGRLLIGGNFFAYDGQIQYGLARLNADGLLDSSFNLNIPPYIAVTAFAKQIDGKIFAAFSFSLSGSPAFPLITRFNTDGSWDASFLSSTSLDITAIAPLSDGKILIGGGFSSIRWAIAACAHECRRINRFDLRHRCARAYESLRVGRPIGW